MIAECLVSNPPDRPTAKEVAVRLRAIAQNRLLNQSSRGSWTTSRELEQGGSSFSQRTISGSSFLKTNNVSGMPVGSFTPSKSSFRSSLDRISGPVSISTIRAPTIDRTPLDGVPPPAQHSQPEPAVAPTLQDDEWTEKVDDVAMDEDTGPIPIFSPFACAVNTRFSSSTCPSEEVTKGEQVASPCTGTSAEEQPGQAIGSGMVLPLG